MKDAWLSALGEMTYGIYVMTAASGNEINGMIASWTTQISYDPPLVAVAVHPNRYTHHLVRQSGAFALHVPAEDQKEFLARFKGPDPAVKFSGLEWERGVTGSPILKDCLAYIECRVREEFSPGNHTLFIGEVAEARVLRKSASLNTTHYEGRYVGKS